jgi:hypothetical protein
LADPETRRGVLPLGPESSFILKAARGLVDHTESPALFADRDGYLRLVGEITDRIEQDLGGAGRDQEDS